MLFLIISIIILILYIAIFRRIYIANKKVAFLIFFIILIIFTGALYSLIQNTTFRNVAGIFIGFFVIVAGLIIWRLITEWRECASKKNIPWIPKWTWPANNMEDHPLSFHIWHSITEFKPKRSYDKESYYHKELYKCLRHQYPEAKWKPKTGSSETDIAIRNIAIEIKGPTSNAELKDLANKVLTYTNYYDILFIVLFNPKFTEGKFLEIRKGIQDRYPEVGIITKSY